MMETLIHFEQVTKFFDLGGSRIDALSEVSLKIAPGGMVALMGPSGSGKSTLLNLLGALDQPSTGKVVISNKDIAQLSLDARAEFRNQAIGFIFQNFNLIPVLSALENVMLPAQLARHATTEDVTARGLALLEQVGLSKQANQSVNRLSGGQMQRVAIARALINRPRIILADEPTANLDHATAAKVLEVLRQMSMSEGATVVIATHDHAVLKYVSRIINMMDGKITTDELREGVL